MKKFEPMFFWRSKDGNIKLEDMETRHLFYTWLMIWNNFCDPEDRVWYKGKKIFNAQTHGASYLEKSFEKMTVELSTRKDLGIKSMDVFKSIKEKSEPEWLYV